MLQGFKDHIVLGDHHYSTIEKQDTASSLTELIKPKLNFSKNRNVSVVNRAADFIWWSPESYENSLTLDSPINLAQGIS